NLRPAAINEKLDSRDKTGIIRGQEQRRLGDFVRFAHASHRDRGHNPCNSVLWLLADGRCFGRTGTEDIRADMAILQFVVPGAHENSCQAARMWICSRNSMV